MLLKVRQLLKGFYFRCLVILFIAGIVSIVVIRNMSKFDGSASRTVSVRELKDGYWEGLQHYFIDLGDAGVYSDKSIVSHNVEGELMRGPNITLPHGSYVLEVECEVLDSSSGTFWLKVTSDRGKETIIEEQVQVVDQTDQKYTATLPFTITDEAEHVEFRVVVDDKVLIKLNRYVCTMV